MVSETRKLVTILFADVVGSTEFAEQRDPEVVRSMMSRYFKRVGEISAAYGGTVEKFAGDAAMVVFGVPVVHDDDAERAVRAAIEIRDGAAELSVRVGVNSGEAVTAVTEDRQFMVSGDAVNVAARLQQGADAGEVLVGVTTHSLTRGAIDYEPHPAVSAKGKAEPLRAFRALRPRSEIPVQARGVPGLSAELVGRRRELRLLTDTFARVIEDRSAHLFTVVGAPGIGKSRLVSEAIERLARAGARVLRGRCLPYGRGITYWPLIEIVRQDTAIQVADETSAALAKLDRWLGELLSGDAQVPSVRARLAVMLGLETPQATMPDTPAERVEREIAWAVRRYLTAVSQTAPLLVVVDDVQWAEPPVITLIEELAERVTDSPMLVVCMARPEFIESRGGWKPGMPNSTTITLDPLSATETATLVSNLLEVEALPDALRGQIVERSAGTPLFCEEYIGMLIDEEVLVREGDRWRATSMVDQIRVPNGINAVLAARLDLLDEEERKALRAASVIGERFGLAQLRALREGTSLERELALLRRKGLVTGGDHGDEEFRFRHLLIRDAAYASVPKRERASLHDRFRAVLEAEAGDPWQLAEILAYHAERALTLSIELRLDESVVAERAAQAVRWLLATAERAQTRNDTTILEGSIQAMRSAAQWLPAEKFTVAGQARLLDAQLMAMKGDYRAAREAAKEAAELAEQARLATVLARARLTEAWILNWTGTATLAEHEAMSLRAIEAARSAGDRSAEIEARQIKANVAFGAGRLDEFVLANLDLLEAARSIGDKARAASILERLAAVESVMGNPERADRYTSEAEALAVELGLRNVGLQVIRMRSAQRLRAGDLAASETLARQLSEAAGEAGSVQLQISGFRFLGQALLIEQKAGEAAEVLDSAIALSESSGERWNRAELLGMRARAAHELGDLELADVFIERALAATRAWDITGTSEVQQHLGWIRAAQGRYAEAESALRLSYDVVAPTGYRWMSAVAAAELARFLVQTGAMDEATTLVNLWEPQVRAIGWPFLLTAFEGLRGSIARATPRSDGDSR